jgi:hypothetical protein
MCTRWRSAKNSNSPGGKNGGTSTGANKSSRNRAIARERAKAERERRREQEEAKAAEAAAARKRAEREQVWMVATLENRSDSSVTYKCSCKSDETILAPGKGKIYTTRSEAVIITFTPKPGSEERRVRLAGTRITGHSPTDGEKNESKINYFKVNANGDLTIYHAH